jgi:hypothetical protein
MRATIPVKAVAWGNRPPVARRSRPPRALLFPFSTTLLRM